MIFPEVAKFMACKSTTHKELAKVIGITQQAITKKLNGESEFKLSELKKIQNYFSDIAPNMKIDDMFVEYYPSGSYMKRNRAGRGA